MPDCSSLTVYHDGSCPLCAAEIAHYREAEGAEALTFVDASAVSPDKELTAGLPADVALSRFHVRDEAGQLISGAAAFALLWQRLPRWRWLGRLVGSPVVLPLADRVYNLFLPLRPHLARLLVRTGILSLPMRRGG
ncbi:thiol-disulfide oxidoreductase DCC family protein [Methylobacterium oxalidis]|uniref:thiol-disulfide oxidoreductase DCC family protein n=1 Tax=Methylobacterium oxalidis TaxID=944322 RepID=UPI003314B8AC